MIGPDNGGLWGGGKVECKEEVKNVFFLVTFWGLPREMPFVYFVADVPSPILFVFVGVCTFKSSCDVSGFGKKDTEAKCLFNKKFHVKFGGFLQNFAEVKNWIPQEDLSIKEDIEFTVAQT